MVKGRRAGPASRRKRSMRSVVMGYRTAALLLALVFVLLLWAAQVLRALSSVVFAAAIAVAVVVVARIGLDLFKGPNAWAGARRVLLVALLVALPTVFDMRTVDSFNLVKFTVLSVGALALAAVWLLERTSTGVSLRWRSGLEWPVLALVGWTTIATLTSISPRMSALGGYGSYDGLITTLGLAIVFFTVCDAFGAHHLQRLLTALWFGAGGLTVLYGLMQLHDRLGLIGGRWDWIKWNEANFPIDSIWSTFGNPNHLAGFLVVMLPIGIALALLTDSTRTRVAIAVMGAVIVVELAFTGTAGAWLAVPVSLAVTGTMLMPELRSRWRFVLAAPIVFCVLAVGTGVVTGPERDLRSQLTGAFSLDGASTGSQRLGYWRAALGMAADRPLTGVGPDLFELRFPRYQDARFVRFNGPLLDVNGPHNTFMIRLASAGIPAVLLFVLLVLGGALRAVGAWRRLRGAELGGSDAGRAATVHRRLLAGIAGATTAYLVQGSFNVEQPGLSVLLWALLGMLAVVTAQAGVPDTLRPGPLLSGGDVPTAPITPGNTGPAPSPAVKWAGVLGALVLAVLAFGVTRPYRADRVHFTGARWRTTAAALEDKEPTRSRNALAYAQDFYAQAAALNPWQSAYQSALGSASYALADALPDGPGSSDARLSLLDQAEDAYRTAAVVEPSFRILNQYAEVLIRIGEIRPTDKAANRRAIDVLTRARAANPWQSRSPLLLSLVLGREGRHDEALRVVERGLAVSPDSTDLLRQAARISSRDGPSSASMERWKRLLEVVPSDAEATKALAGSTGPATGPAGITEGE